ncbi:sterol desaturase family protein [Candidatus Binatus sp.]|uniref:sterol desaturase family protein n=1 Tax=Candidatus Binatus sp. TaxID=2811406 RepID=UPI003BB00F51
MLGITLIFVAGLFAWTLLEYIIHGVLAHSHRTFVTPLHNEHHVDPRAVFAMRAYIPTAIVLTVLLTIFRMAPGMIFLFGIVTGFAVYEYLHYRIHFATPSSAIEARLRARHLAHHLREPDAIFGVTTRIWDVAFGTEPAPERMRELAVVGATVAPLSGSSNLGRVIRSRIAAS